MDRISALETEITEIRKTLSLKEKELYDLKKKWVPLQQCSIEDRHSFGDCQNIPLSGQLGKLPRWAIERYSRQILLSDIGVQGQEKLCAAKVLIVGAGGLGCPAAMFLAGAGVGELGIVDYDTVEITNIHRQLLHGESDENMNKVDSAAYTLRNINSRIKITPYKVSLDSSNALEIATQYDLILDCTDNVPTRLLLNDLAVLLNVPLISGSALKMEGQLTIYGYRSEKHSNETERSLGPCYRCVFPSPPPPEAVGSCSAQGVAGPVCGLIGTLQALEAIKYIVGHSKDKLLVCRMLLFDGEDSTFKTVRLRPRNPACAACGDAPTVTRLIDYETYCRMQAKEKDIDLKILPPENRIEATALSTTLADDNSKQRHLLVDVRSAPEFRMCNIGGVNVPIDTFRDTRLDALADEVRRGKEVTVICRRGNDSQLAASRLMAALDREHRGRVRDLVGGLHAWARHVDTNFPQY